MIACNRRRDVLHQNRLTSPRWGDDQRPLSFTNWTKKVDDSCCQVLWIKLHLELFHWIKRRQVIEDDLFCTLIWRRSVDLFDLEKSKVSLTIFWRANLSRNRITSPQIEAANLTW